MNFIEALNLADKGEKVTCSVWNNYTYLEVVDHRLRIVVKRGNRPELSVDQGIGAREIRSDWGLYADPDSSVSGIDAVVELVEGNVLYNPKSGVYYKYIKVEGRHAIVLSFNTLNWEDSLISLDSLVENKNGFYTFVRVSGGGES